MNRVYWRQTVENVEELIQERLAFDAEQKMFEMVVREIRSPACVTPQFHRGHMRFFVSHDVLDWRMEGR